MLAPAFGADSSWRAPGSNVEPEASGKLERMLQRVAQKLDVIAGEQSRMSDRLAKLELSAETYRSNTAGMGGLSPIPESFKKMSIAAGDSSNPRLSMRGPSANDAALKKIAKLQGEEVSGTETHASTSHFSREETTPNRRAMAKRFLIPPHSKFRFVTLPCHPASRLSPQRARPRRDTSRASGTSINPADAPYHPAQMCARRAARPGCGGTAQHVSSSSS